MGLDYILNIYCYSESHASCEANHQVNKTINARRGVGAWRVVLKWCLEHVKFATRTNQVRTVLSRNLFECLQPEISSFLLSRVDITGLQIKNSPTSHVPRATLSIYCSVCLRADVSHFLCCTRATKEKGEVCTQATVLPISLIVTVNSGSCLMIASQEAWNSG